jgi:hypothetical protein
MHLATRSAIERAIPVLIGVAAGVVGFILAPASAGPEFFSTTAQGVPVLLLALVLEVRLFGSARRALVRYDAARRIDAGRRCWSLRRSSC